MRERKGRQRGPETHMYVCMCICTHVKERRDLLLMPSASEGVVFLPLFCLCFWILLRFHTCKWYVFRRGSRELAL